MTTTTSDQMRAWHGPAILSYGFRPFFLGGSCWAAMAMVLWIAMLTGYLALPTSFDPVSWHAHEFLFGYMGAVAAGFLLTAVPNWTGWLPIVGWPLGWLATLWLAGRLAMAVSGHLPVWLVAGGDLAFPLVLALAIGREIVTGRNWRNLTVLTMLTVLVLGTAVFQWEAANGYHAAQGAGLRIGLGTGIMMIAVIGGRIIPSFTRNWMVRRGEASLPVPPMQWFDRLALIALLAALLVWVIRPEAIASGIALLVVGGIHLVRLARWRGHRTLAEPLVLVLHVGYLFLPLGALAIGAEILLPGTFGRAASEHLWTAGAIGMMTLAVMTRASLGHTGQALAAGPATIAIYVSIGLATLFRVCAGRWPEAESWLHPLAGLAFVLAFLGFALAYGPALVRPLRRN